MDAPHGLRAPLVLACGPRAGGNSDRAARLLADALASAGADAELLALRDAAPQPCVGCQACARSPEHACPLMEEDGAEGVFARIMAAPLLFIVSPIYYYHLPGQFKGFIDRSQRFYEARRAGDPSLLALPRRTAHACLVAGRKKGERLFEGALLTLKYFLEPFNVSLGEPLTLLGLDRPDDLEADPAAQARVAAIAAASVTRAQG